jgi:hypothetical protein
MSKLYIFGDSYSTPGFCVEPKDSWWGLLANKLNIEGVENFSWPGNNIDSIAHIIVANSNLFNLEDYIVIGVPPIERLTIFENDATSKLYTKFDNKLHEVKKPQVPCHGGLTQLTRHQLGRQEIDLWNRSWQEAQILRQLITLTAYLEKITKRILILNLSEPFQPITGWSTLNSLQKQAYNDPRILIDQNTYYSVNYNVNQPADFETHAWFGHQGAAGNRHWFDTAILPKLKELQWA